MAQRALLDSQFADSSEQNSFAKSVQTRHHFDEGRGGNAWATQPNAKEEPTSMKLDHFENKSPIEQSANSENKSKKISFSYSATPTDSKRQESSQPSADRTVYKNCSPEMEY